MFGTLIESMARPQRRPGGSIASLLTHAALIGGAVLATAGHRVVPTLPPLDAVPVVFRVPVAPPPALPRSRAPADVFTQAPSLPALQVPMITPATIPQVDFAQPTMAIDFPERPAHDADHGCRGICDQRGAEDGSPMWAGNDAIMQLRDQVVPPRYPERLRQIGIEGRVVVKFVVDTLGRVDPTTIEVVESTADQFTSAVRETLARLRFNPAMIRSHKVRATAMMPFEFRIR